MSVTVMLCVISALCITGVLAAFITVRLLRRKGSVLLEVASISEVPHKPIDYSKKPDNISITYESFFNISVKNGDLTVIIDEVIVRDNGVFVIVKKNRSGRIVGNERERKWFHMKRDSHKEMLNPIKEAKLKTFVLSKKLQSLGINVWVQGVVLFVNPYIEIVVGNPSVPVLKLAQLDQYLLQFVSNRRFNSDQISKVIYYLRGIK
ncbi:nuclease-related domain-containing protein [Paenibacillus sp. MMO-177]|uniref:nuclease-related domain-containing protein n=1 Tax=Paenibacillus sp. MMO-177 TaxID=3081289 RepID=UPI003019F8CC